MKLRAVHTCPLWEDEDGRRRPGLHAENVTPEVVGWCNVAVVEIAGEVHLMLLTKDAG